MTQDEADAADRKIAEDRAEFGRRLQALREAVSYVSGELESWYPRGDEHFLTARDGMHRIGGRIEDLMAEYGRFQGAVGLREGEPERFAMFFADRPE